MYNIKVLGSGCAKCRKLSEESEKAAKAAGVEYTLEKVTDMDDILDYGVMMTPALVINEEVKSSGKIPSSDDLKSLFKQ